MGTEQDKEKLFAAELDRLLAGSQPKTGQDADADLRSAIEFARKMTAIRPQPDPVYSARLKAALLQKLAAREEAAVQARERSWFRRLIPRSPVWQAATAALVILMIFGITWAAGRFNQPQSLTVAVPSPVAPDSTVPGSSNSAALAPRTTAATAKPAATSAPAAISPPALTATSAPATSVPPILAAGIALQAGATTDKAVYAAGEDVKITVRLTNINSGTVRLDQFPPLSLMRADTKMPEYTFAATSVGNTLAPYETASYTFDWNQTDFKGVPAPAGSYYIELEDLNYQGRNIQLSLSQPAAFNILPKY